MEREQLLSYKRLCPSIKREPLENPIQQNVPKRIVLLIPNNHPLLKLAPLAALISTAQQFPMFHSWDPLSVESTIEKSLPPPVYYKSRAQRPVASFYS
ncbi:hypothetical protein TNCV_2368591 [Trichonephila clavipes]|nr:hypothetical protein TNCV_2368591 [Trichonephila clavipes]